MQAPLLPPVQHRDSPGVVHAVASANALGRTVRPATGDPVISSTRWCGSAPATARPVEITMVPGSLSDSKA